MHVRYDRSCNAAYVYLRAIEPGGVRRTDTVETLATERLLSLDFDAAGLLVAPMSQSNSRADANDRPCRA